MAEWAFVHDDRATIAERLERVLRERIRPADPPRGRAAGASPPGTCRASRCRSPRRCARRLRAVRGRRGVGAAVGHDLVPADRRGAGGVGRPRVEAVVDLGWSTAWPGFQAEGLVHRRTAPSSRASTRATTGSRSRPAQRSTCYVEAAANPLVLGDGGFRPTAAAATGRPPATEPLYRLAARRPGRSGDDGVGELVHDLEVLDELMPRAAGRTTRAAGRSCARWSGRWTRSTSTTCRAPRRGAGRARARCWPARRTPSAHRVSRGRPRAHRLGLAVAAARDRAQGRPHASPTWSTCWTPIRRVGVRDVLRPSSTPG